MGTEARNIAAYDFGSAAKRGLFPCFYTPVAPLGRTFDASEFIFFELRFGKAL